MRVLEERFGPEVRVAASPLIFGDEELYPEERALGVRAVEKRRRELAAGRVLARRVLRELGCADGPLLRGPDWVPLWPAGVVGSIAHSRGLCVAVASRQAAALGVDVEEETPLEERLISMVAVEREVRWLESQPAEARGVLAKLIFSAKECAYKAQYTFTKKLLDFPEVELTIDRAAGTFEASVLPGVRGFFVFEGGQLITGIKVPKV